MAIRNAVADKVEFGVKDNDTLLAESFESIRKFLQRAPQRSGLVFDMMGYLYLAIAIVSEVIGTIALKASSEFTKLVPSLIVVIGYGAAFYFMTLALRTIPLGITYAVWSGIGIVLITIAGVFLYREIPDFPAIIGMTLIISGVAVIHLFSKTVGH